MTTAPNSSPTGAALWIAGARPRTLPAAVVPVVVGAGAAAGSGESFGDGVVWWRVLLALVVSLLLQIAVNYANDYSDGVRGTDDDRVGPLRLVGSGAAAPGAVKRAAFAALGLAAVAGLVLAAATTWWLLLVGVFAMLATWGYTGGPMPYGYLGLGELFVFVFFGLVATAGTTYVAIETVPAVTWLGAAGVGLLACALLEVNNLRDIPTDRESGKRTLAVRLGDATTRRLFALTYALAFACAVVAGFDRAWSLLALLAIPVAVAPLRIMLSGVTGRDLIPVLGATGRTHLLYGLLLAVGFAVG